MQFELSQVNLQHLKPHRQIIVIIGMFWGPQMHAKASFASLNCTHFKESAHF